MSMLEIHAKALASQVDVYHSFLVKYSKTSRKVYGFFEGQADPCYYRFFIENSISSDWQLESFIVNGKKNVIEMYKKFDWKRFPKTQVGFFVDTDLSVLLDESIPNGINFYTTDFYSIENSIVNVETFQRVLEEIYGLNTIARFDLNKILLHFEKQKLIFMKLMIPIMAYILLWRSRGEKLNLNNIDLKKIFFFADGSVCVNDAYLSRKDLISYVMKTCGVMNKKRDGVGLYEKKFKRANVYKKFVRGKFLLWFFLNISDYVYRNLHAISPCIVNIPKKCIDLTQKNAMQIISSRSRIPKSLSDFIEKNYVTYQKNCDQLDPSTAT